MSRAEFSKRTKLEAFKRSGGQCECCTARLFVGKYDFHHVKEDTFGGEPTLENCKVLCTVCHDKITGARAAVIAKSNRIRAKHLGIKRKSGFKGWRKFDGSPVYANVKR